jgi:hypothetical protein
MPHRGFFLEGKNTHGIKEGKDRFTAVLAVTQSGEVLKPLIVGKSENPRSFSKFTNKSFYYDNSPTAWVTRTIFEKYIYVLNNTFSSQNRKVAIIIDNCSAHYIQSKKFSNISLFYLPQNTTAITQPLDTGIIEISKRKCRTSLAKMKLDFIYKHLDLKENFAIDFFTAANLYCKCVKNISSKSIINCWKRVVFTVD